MAAALIGLGVPEQEMIQIIKSAAEKFGMKAGSDMGELVTSTGAAILATLAPKFTLSDHIPPDSKRIGLGLD